MMLERTTDLSLVPVMQSCADLEVLKKKYLPKTIEVDSKLVLVVS